MDTAIARRLLCWLQSQDPAMSHLLAQLVVAESPSSDAAAQTAVHTLLAGQFRELGYRVRSVPGNGSGAHLLAVPRARHARGPWQLLLGHLDTVWPVGTLATMPFAAQQDRYTGPGILDMKAGLVQAIYALAALHALGLTAPVTPIVFVSSDEEIGSATSARWIRRLARVAVRAFVLEPAFGPRGALKTARKGVGQFRVRIIGRAAHAGLNPEVGLSAILELSHQVQRLFALNDPARGITVNVGTIDGGLRPNVVAPEASAVVDVRVPTMEAARHVEAAIRALTPLQAGVVVEVEGGIERPPMESTPRNQALWRCAAAAAAALGFELEEAHVGGASDGNFTSLYTATLDGLGSVGDGAHAADEYVERGRLAERAALLAMLVLCPAEQIA